MSCTSVEEAIAGDLAVFSCTVPGPTLINAIEVAMKSLNLWIWSVATVACLAGPAHAQANSGDEGQAPPVLPMEIRLRHVDQYFAQAIEDDARYSRIEAVFASGSSEINLMA